MHNENIPRKRKYSLKTINLVYGISETNDKFLPTMVTIIFISNETKLAAVTLNRGTVEEKDFCEFKKS